jgi:hypothetical protein
MHEVLVGEAFGKGLGLWQYRILAMIPGDGMVGKVENNTCKL